MGNLDRLARAFQARAAKDGAIKAMVQAVMQMTPIMLKAGADAIWRPVHEVLPKPCQEVIVYTTDGGLVVCTFEAMEECGGPYFVTSYGAVALKCTEVSHWLPFTFTLPDAEGYKEIAEKVQEQMITAMQLLEELQEAQRAQAKGG